MSKILIINSSALGDASVSAGLTAQFAERLKAADPSIEIKVRDVGAEPFPHLVAETVSAVRGTAESEAARRTLALSDAAVAELQEADLLVIGAPMYNFGITSTLKTWFDHVLRAGVTFRYTETGPEGLVTGKKAVVIESRGGLYSAGPAGVNDAQEPHLRALLGFIGITDVTFVRVEQLAFGPEAVAAALAGAKDELAALAQTHAAVAA